MLSAGSYFAGAVELLAIAGGALLGGTALRRRLRPGWAGSPAALATAGLAIALLVWVGEILGSAGLFDDLALVIALALVGAGLNIALRGEADAPKLAARPPDRDSPLRLPGLAIAAVVIAHFTIGVRLRLGTGMTGFDSTWYHGPFAAGFAQSGQTFDIQFIAPQFLAWFYPQNSELLHGIGMVAFDRDLMSPLLNLGWLCGCLFAAWCIGRPYGASPVSLAAVAVCLDTGTMADQAGEARNDLAAIFFVLAALAIAINAGARRGDRRLSAGILAVVGIAAGLAAGTKVNYLAPAVAIVAGMAVYAPAGERRRAFFVSGLAALAGGGYWYLRNLVHAGNPLPWIKHLGPLDLPSPDQPLGGRAGHSVLGYLTDGSIWSDWFLPGLHQGFGVLWPVMLLLAAAGLVLAAGRRSEPMLRIAALVGLVLAGAWLVAPTSASGPDGIPRGYLSGLRYLVPAIAVGMALLPTVPSLRFESRRFGLLLVLAATLPFADASGEPWHSGYLLAALAAGALAAASAWVLASGAWRRLPRRAAAGIAIAILAVALVAGERGQRTYLRNRYANPQFTVAGLDAAFLWARDMRQARIATTATRELPFFGTDLSNRVRFVGIHEPHAGFVRPETCGEWRRALNEGDYDFVVASRDRLERGEPAFPPEAAWTESDPAATVILRRAPTVVFRIRGELDPGGCGG